MKIKKLSKEEVKETFPVARLGLKPSEQTAYLKQMILGGKRNRDIQELYPYSGAYIDRLRTKLRRQGYDIPNIEPQYKNDRGERNK